MVINGGFSQEAFEDMSRDIQRACFPHGPPTLFGPETYD